MTATIKLVTNAEGTHEIDIQDILIQGDGILEYLIYHLFDEDEGVHKDLVSMYRDTREIALRESGYIIESVDDPDEIAEHFFHKDGSGVNSFNLSGYEEVADLMDKPSSSYSGEAIAAYIEWAGEWSQSDFDGTHEGAYASDKKFVQSKMDEGEDKIPEWIRPYFDWDQYTSDFMSDYHEQAGHYFSCM